MPGDGAEPVLCVAAGSYAAIVLHGYSGKLYNDISLVSSDKRAARLSVRPHDPPQLRALGCAQPAQGAAVAIWPPPVDQRSAIGRGQICLLKQQKRPLDRRAAAFAVERRRDRLPGVEAEQ